VDRLVARNREGFCLLGLSTYKTQDASHNTAALTILPAHPHHLQPSDRFPRLLYSNRLICHPIPNPPQSLSLKPRTSPYILPPSAPPTPATTSCSKALSQIPRLGILFHHNRKRRKFTYSPPREHNPIFVPTLPPHAQISPSSPSIETLPQNPLLRCVSPCRASESVTRAVLSPRVCRRRTGLGTQRRQGRGWGLETRWELGKRVDAHVNFDAAGSGRVLSIAMYSRSREG
jgi:hypothetical protein